MLLYSSKLIILVVAKWPVFVIYWVKKQSHTKFCIDIETNCSQYRIEWKPLVLSVTSVVRVRKGNELNIATSGSSAKSAGPFTFFFFFLSLPHISVFSQQINTSHTELKLAGRGTTQKISIGVDNVAENVFIAMALMESHYHFTVEFPNLL